MVRRFSAVVLLILALAGCGGNRTAERGCSGDVEGVAGVRLTYRAADGAAAADLRAAAEKMCRRIEGLGAERPAVAVEGERIVVVLPEDTPPAVADYVASPGRVAIYDWEAVLLDEQCKREPDHNANERRPIVGRERADGIAARCGRAARVVRQQRTDPAMPEPDAWWVIRGEPALDGEDVVDPVQLRDELSGEPMVAMELTPAGQDRFTRMTRAIAQRGADNALPGMPAVRGAHHFAIVLDDELVTTPYIDYDEHPDGIRGQDGVQISGGYTVLTARVLARLLDLGPLPVDLELVERREQR